MMTSHVLCDHWKREGRRLEWSADRRVWLVDGKQEPNIETVDPAGARVVIFVCEPCRNRQSVRPGPEQGSEDQTHAEM